MHERIDVADHRSFFELNSTSHLSRVRAGVICFSSCSGGRILNYSRFCLSDEARLDEAYQPLTRIGALPARPREI
jgi:hypothetical protein